MMMMMVLIGLAIKLQLTVDPLVGALSDVIAESQVEACVPMNDDNHGDQQSAKTQNKRT